MNIPGARDGDDRDAAFDLAAQRYHVDALEAVAPQTRARLRAARQAAASASMSPVRFGPGWLVAGGSAAALALALLVQWQLVQPDAAAPVQTTATTAPAPEPVDPAFAEFDSLSASLDENPDLYLWLAANDENLPAPSER